MKMANRKLGTFAVKEITESMARCASPAERSAEAARLAAHFSVGKQRIYEITARERAAAAAMGKTRKPRSDKGKRAMSFENENLKTVAGWIIEFNMNPAEALLTAEKRGIGLPIELPTLQRYLREKGLTRKERRKPVTSHRRFEAAAPGEMFQFDISGLKERWFDTQKRKIVNVSSLEVSKNHENNVKTRVRVWRFALIDDHSRLVFVRYYAVDKPNSSHVVDFLLLAYSVMGVPQVLYTDNDSIIKFQRNKFCSEILGKALADSGGYQLQHHLPGNSRATGKVERLHQTVEELEKAIGLFIAEGREITLEILNEKLAANIMWRINNRVHSETGEMPVTRWQSSLSVIRRVDYELLKSVFMADEFEVKIHGDLTVNIKGEKFQLPTDSVFQNWINRKVKIIFAADADFFTLVGLDGNEYDIAKHAAAPDAAHDFRANAESDSEKLRKELKKHAREQATAVKEIRKHTPDIIESAPIAIFDAEPLAKPVSNLLDFPKPEIAVTPETIAVVAPARVAQANILFSGGLITFWQAVTKYESDFPSKAECKIFLDTLFETRAATLPESTIRAAAQAHTDAPQTQTERKLKIV